MEIATILTVKQAPFEALIRSLQLYMEQDECVCDALSDLPLFSGNACPPDCEQCTWCIGRKALRGVGIHADETTRPSDAPTS